MTRKLFTSRSEKLLFSTLLGLITIGASATQASANPLQAIPIVGEILEAATGPAPLPDQLDVMNGNMNANNVSVCVLTCIPGALPGLPTGARSPQPGPSARSPMPGQLPPGVRPPTPGQIPPGAQPTAPRSSSPNVTIDLSPINIPL